MRSNAVSDGFTLLEMIITVALAGALFLAGVRALRSNQGVWKQSRDRHLLEAEEGEIVDLLGGLLRRADPSTLVIDSTTDGPWSRLRFAAGGHQYAFYWEKGIVWFRTDELPPKPLSSHGVSLQFAVARSRLPTVLTWSLCLGMRGVKSLTSRVDFSATQYLEQPPE